MDSSAAVPLSADQRFHGDTGTVPRKAGVDMADLIPGGSVVDQFRRRDFDTETAETDIGELGRCQQLDRGDAQILENLGAEPDLAPLPRARNLGTGRARLRDGMGRHPRGTVAEEHDDAAAFLLESLEGGVHWIGAAKDIADDI